MMRKKSYKFKIGILILLIGFLITPKCVFAEDFKTLGDYRRKYESLLAQKRQNDNKTAEAKRKIAEKEAAAAKAEEDLSRAVILQDEAKKKIEESNVKIEENKKESEKVIAYMQQMQSKNAYLEYVTGSSSMTELVTRIEAIKQVTDYIQITLNNLESEIDKNEQLTIELEKKQKELDKQIETYEATIKKLYGDVDDYNAYAEDIGKEVDSAKKLYDMYKKQCKQEIGRDDDSVVVSTCTKVPLNSGWLKPLNRGITTSPIGYRWGSYHNALDIDGGAEGTPIYAAAAGTVAAVYHKTSCGGNKVFIHVNVGGINYTTFYYHLLKVNVKVGDVVNQNTVIGTIGGRTTATYMGGYDRCSKGAHLHFGVAKGLYYNHTTKVMTPPGFPNKAYYRFTSRTDFYRG